MPVRMSHDIHKIVNDENDQINNDHDEHIDTRASFLMFNDHHLFLAPKIGSLLFVELSIGFIRK